MSTEASNQIQLLKQHLDNAAASLKHQSGSNEQDGMGSLIYLGNHQDAIPRNLILDPILESGEIHTWTLMKIHISNPAMPSSIPSQNHLMEILKCSRPILSRHLQVLRALRWITLCAEVRGDDGQFKGNVYTQHDSPLSLQDTLYLDSKYMNFLEQPTKGSVLKRLREIKDATLRHIDFQVVKGIELDKAPSHLEQVSNKLNTVPEIKHNPLDTSLAFPAESIEPNLVIGLYGNNKKDEFAHRENNFYMDGKPESNHVKEINNLENLSNISNINMPERATEQDYSLVKDIHTVSHVNFDMDTGSSSSNIYIKKTTTTNPSSLRFPEALKKSRRLELFAEKTMNGLSEEKKQFCLDYLDDRIKAGDKGTDKAIGDAVAYLSWVVRHVKSDSLPPSSYGIRVDSAQSNTKNDRKETTDESKQKMRDHYDAMGVEYDYETLAIIKNG